MRAIVFEKPGDESVLRTGRLRPVIDRVFALEQAAEADRLVQSGVHFGKVVLKAG